MHKIIKPNSQAQNNEVKVGCKNTKCNQKDKIATKQNKNATNIKFYPL